MREIVHIQAGQCGNQIGAKVSPYIHFLSLFIHSPTEVRPSRFELYSSHEAKFEFFYILQTRNYTVL